MTQPSDQLADQLTDTTTDHISESVGRSYGRTRRTNEDLTNPPLKSFTSVPRARISSDRRQLGATAALRASRATMLAAIRRGMK